VAVKIRLKRMGKIRQPFYRIVVADSRTRRDGRVIEEIGKYHPKEDPSVIEVDSERAQHWLSVGAQPSEPVLALLRLTGDWQKFKGEAAPGPIKVKDPKRTKEDIFNEALKDVADAPKAEAVTTPRRKKADAAEAPAAEAPAAEAPADDAPADDAPADEAPSTNASAADADSPAVEAADGAKA
jgi:small subunit ribosomal protein S16